MNKENYVKGLVSIITPCYNGEQFIKETIDSVESQTYPNWEMLIIDDGSTDNSEKIVNQYVEKDSRIKLIKQKNAGSAAARNNGIRQAQGQYIALLDSDDIWLPEFLNDQIEFMNKKNAFCVCSSYSRIDEYSDEILSPVIAKPVIALKDMEAIDYIGCLTGLYDCSKYGKVFLHTELKSLLDDYAYWIDVIKLSGTAYGNQKVLSKYRIRKNSLTGKKTNLISKHYSFYRNYLKFGRLHSVFNTAKWGLAGIKKYSR